MTTPTTEAGRRLCDAVRSILTADMRTAADYIPIYDEVAAIEAEARAGWMPETDCMDDETPYLRGRADALREAAERVRALRETYAADAIADGYLQTKSRTELVVATLDSVLAILDPETGP